MQGKLLAVVVAVVIGLALLPVVNDFVENLTRAAEEGPPIVEAGPFYDTTVGSLIKLLPILYVLIIVAGTIGYVVLSNKKA